MKRCRLIIGILLVVVGIAVSACSFIQHHGRYNRGTVSNCNQTTIRENNQRQHMGPNRRFDFLPNKGQFQPPNLNEGGQR